MSLGAEKYLFSSSYSIQCTPDIEVSGVQQQNGDNARNQSPHSQQDDRVECRPSVEVDVAETSRVRRVGRRTRCLVRR